MRKVRQMSNEIRKSTRVSIVIPEALRKEMSDSMARSGYGLHSISLWVSEALELLLENPRYPDLVKIGDSMSHFKKTLFIALEPDLYEQLNKAVIHVRTEFPVMDGVKSRLLRTAIIQRLLRPEGNIRSPNKAVTG